LFSDAVNYSAYRPYTVNGRWTNMSTEQYNCTNIGPRVTTLLSLSRANKTGES
jgi:hypothetical protein